MPRFTPTLLIACLAVTGAHASTPLEGVVLPFHEVDISAQATGPLVELKVKEGESVIAGQPLARIYGRLQELEVERAKANLERHEFDAKGAKKLWRCASSSRWPGSSSRPPRRT
jgi:multidrug efflux pump subunit AcrA (membrane-fusion protein)